MNVLEVNGLCKKYEKFALKNVSFQLHQGEIMGFIGRNGAGKTTTLKSLFNFVHPDDGEIVFFGENFKENEFNIKQRIGFVSGGFEYYPKKKIKTISEVTKKFYDNWDEEAYEKYMELFALDEGKTPDQLSAGMKVKYSLVLALSHRAELFILDEPTSGLDPVSRDEILEIFLELSHDGKTILFSTHITSDLDKCADRITYIKKGEILASEGIDDFLKKYKQIDLTQEVLNSMAASTKEQLIGIKLSKHGYTALIDSSLATSVGLPISDVDLEAVMVHLEKE